MHGEKEYMRAIMGTDILVTSRPQFFGIKALALLLYGILWMHFETHHLTFVSLNTHKWVKAFGEAKYR